MYGMFCCSHVDVEDLTKMSLVYVKELSVEFWLFLYMHLRFGTWN